MSTVYEAMLNRIKALVCKDWLTPSQARVYERLVTGFDTHAMLNVHGPKGCGKTVLGWVLAREQGYVHSCDVDPRTWGRRTILDLHSRTLSREEARKARSQMMLAGLERMIVLTRLQVPDDIVHMQLELTDADIRAVKHNFLIHLGYQLLVDAENLHELILKNIEEGHII